MRAIYAAHLLFAPDTSASEVVRVAGAWPCRGRAPREVCTSWEPGRRTYELPVTGHTLDVEVREAPDGRLWEASWRHPHVDDPDLHMVNDVTVAELDGHVSASLVIRTVWARPRLAMPRFSMRAPRLVRDLLEQFEVLDAGHRLNGQPHVLDAAGAERFVDDLLLNEDRRHPVLFISDDPRTLRPLVDPAELASELAGMAHVYYSLYGYPAALVSEKLGAALGCRNGAMRLWWPGLRPDSHPYEHRMYAASSLRDWHGPASPVEAVFRTLSVAAATNAAPPAHAALRRAARRAALAAMSDVSEATEIAELAMEENEKLVEQLKESEDRQEMALLERDDTLRELEELRNDKRRSERAMAEAFAEIRPETLEFDTSNPSPQSVLEAVQQAKAQCPHLAFADRAFESARDSPYEFPSDILDDLLKLERLAAPWARPEGIGGMDLAAKAKELGLHWRGGVSSTTTGGARARQYEFTWRGEKRQLGPHTPRDRGNGAGRIARIYLDKFEPEDPAGRLFLVGHVGRKLDDSTTG